jgi:CubicO group peptidase (beta-lactamase class C family)
MSFCVYFPHNFVVLLVNTQSIDIRRPPCSAKKSAANPHKNLCVNRLWLSLRRNNSCRKGDFMNRTINDVALTPAQILSNGYDYRRFDALIKHFERIVEKELIHGACWCIRHKGHVISNGAVGYGAWDHTCDMQPDTVFGIASLTKTFTSAAIMALMEDGLVRLDAPVTEYISEFPFGDIAVWHLLTHTSGLYPDPGTFPNENMPDYYDAMMDAAGRKGSDFSWVEEAFSVGRRMDSGKEWAYCSFGFVVLGEIITRMSGKKSADFITERIIKPVGLDNTAFVLSPEMAKRYYCRNESVKAHIDKIIKGEDQIDNSEEGKIWSIVREKLPAGSGGLQSTASDLAKYGEIFINYGKTGSGERILGRKAVEKMTTNQLSNVPDFCWFANGQFRRYGMGFDMRQSPAFTWSEGSFHHEGAGPSALYIDRREELVAAWYAPWDKGDWCADPLWNAQNVIWAGLD